MSEIKSSNDDLKKVIRKNFPEQVSFLQALVRAKSANPFTPDNSDPRAPIELEVAKLIEKKLKSFGFKPQRIAPFPQKRPNLVLKISGSQKGKTLIFNGHMDTVLPVLAYSFNPWSGKIVADKLFGVGAADMKASLSAFIFVVRALQDLKIKLAGDLILTFVVDEETSSCSPFGTAYLLKKGLRGDAAIVGEPRTDKIVIGHRGRYLFKITTFGEAAHTGMIEWEKGQKGHNAILDMGKIITLLDKITIPLVSSAAFPDTRSVFTFPTKIEGGTAGNIVPEKCVAYGDVRLLPGVDPAEIKKLMFKKLAVLKGKAKFEIADIIKFPGVAINPREKIVQVMFQEAKKVLKKEPRLVGCRPACDGWMLIKKGIPTVCGFGPDGDGVHSKDEWVDLKSLEKVTEIYTRTTISYLGQAG